MNGYISVNGRIYEVKVWEEECEDPYGIESGYLSLINYDSQTNLLSNDMESHPPNQFSAKEKEDVDLLEENIVSESKEDGKMENQVHDKVDREETSVDLENIHSSEANVNFPNGEDERDTQCSDNNGEDGVFESDEESNDSIADDSSSKAKMTTVDYDIDESDLVSTDPLIKYVVHMRQKKRRQTIKGKCRNLLWTKNPLKAALFSRTFSRDHNEDKSRRLKQGLKKGSIDGPNYMT